MMLAPANSSSGGGLVPFSGDTIIVVLIVAAIALFVALGWRSPERPPGADTKAERERIDD